MAKRNAALTRAEKALSGARKRATDLRQKMKTDQPVQIASTVAGGALAGWIDKENPDWIQNMGVTNPSLVFSAVLIGYGLFSARSGQAEKFATSAGTGMLTAYVYNTVKDME